MKNLKANVVIKVHALSYEQAYQLGVELRRRAQICWDGGVHFEVDKAWLPNGQVYEIKKIDLVAGVHETEIKAFTETAIGDFLNSLDDWRTKTNVAISKLSREAFDSVNRQKDGTLRRKLKPYSVPSMARLLSDALGEDDQHVAEFILERLGRLL